MEGSNDIIVHDTDVREASSLVVESCVSITCSALIHGILSSNDIAITSFLSEREVSAEFLMVFASVLAWSGTWFKAAGAVLEKVLTEEDLFEVVKFFTEGERVVGKGMKGLAKGEKALAEIESGLTDEGF